MKVLLDTNIVIHREASRVVNKGIGILFWWLEKLHHEKTIHAATVTEFEKLQGPTRETMLAKLQAYTVLKVPASLHPDVVRICGPLDKNDNDRVDTTLVNHVYRDRVDLLITEDGNLRKKAKLLGIDSRVVTIETFLVRVAAENPGLSDYKVLAVRKEPFGNVDVSEEFFQSFHVDYPGFERWFNRKSEEAAYVCRTDGDITAFLYLKLEGPEEPYPDIVPSFQPCRRLKIGTLKVALNGHRLGERFLKIVFDNALRNKVAEIYVTIFERTAEQRRLIELLQEFGFVLHGNKAGGELVYVRKMTGKASRVNPTETFPFMSRDARAFIVPIYPDYHTSLLPDSILKTESPANFVENEPFRNAIKKVYISRSHRRDMESGDIIVFYRTGGYYKSVVTTLGIVESVVSDISTESEFIAHCRNRSVFSNAELLKHWNYYQRNRPFVVNFLYAYSFPKRINLERLIQMGIVKDVGSAPRGFELITQNQLADILRDTQSDDRVIVD